MRDAFGGAFSIKLMLIFLMLYVAFICVALNYARAFRIINIIEQYEGYCGDNREQINNDINSYLSKTGYYISKDDVVGYIGKDGNESYECLNGFNNDGNGYGYCVYNKNNNSLDCSDKSVYSVETYMIFKLPIINIRFPIVIKGETRPVDRLK